MVKDRIKGPIAKAIIIVNRKHKDILHICNELCNALNNSMTTELRLLQLSQFLTSTKLEKINRKSSQQNFIIHFTKIAHTYNEINDTDHFSDNQLIGFLNVSVSGVPNLAQVLTNNHTSRRAANNNTTDLTWNEYVKVMIQHAQVYDATNTHTRNPKAQAQVNFLKHFFNGDMPPTTFDFDQSNSISDGYHMFEVNVNNQTHRPPFNSNRRNYVRMNHETWDSLSKQSHDAWDLISDEDKTSIL